MYNYYFTFINYIHTYSKRFKTHYLSTLMILYHVNNNNNENMYIQIGCIIQFIRILDRTQYIYLFIVIM